jgi:hypothetical protein
MKKFVFGLLFTFLSVFLFAQNTSDFEIKGNDDGTITILDYKGLAKDIVIPEKIFNMPVSRLMKGAFENKGLASVVIPNAISFIDDNTFSKNQLTMVTIPATVEYIGNYAFADNQLVSITIPEKVAIIGDGAFAENRLTSIRIPDSVTFIGKFAFHDNSITNVIIGDGVVYIGSNAFDEGSRFDKRNQITSITLGNSIKYIGDGAFRGHEVSTIVIPESVVFIGSEAFSPKTQDSLINITIGKYVMFGGSNVFSNYFRDGEEFDIIYQNTGKRAGKYAYANNNWSYTP